MNASSWAKLEKLADRCAEALRDPRRQSEHIWRGDMWAVISACHDIRKARALRGGTSRLVAEAKGCVVPEVENKEREESR